MGENGQPASGARGPAEKARRATDWVYGNRSNWLRGLLMLGFFIVLGLIKVLVGLMALFQFGSLLINGEPNERLARFGSGLAAYTCELVDYLTCAEERLPFPFSDWPASHP
jgi:hypothetical protein